MQSIEMCVRDRLKAYLKKKEIAQNFFADAIGVSYGYVNAISKGIGTNKIAVIAAKFPDLNIEWLLTGEGQMLNTQLDQPAAGSDAISPNGTDYQTMKEMKLFEALERRDREVDRLIRIIERMQEVDTQKVGGGILNP